MLVPVACRFVPYDQWLVTHLDDELKVKQAKLWILSKCNLIQSPGPHIRRSVSPIVFASSIASRSSIDSLDDGYNEDDEHSDHDLLPRHPTTLRTAIYPCREPEPGPSSQSASSPLVDQYNLLSFSTGSMLEDEFVLSWYHLRPYELLEMHPVGFVAPLHRDVLADYIQPYFQARVRVLRAVWNRKSGRFEAPPGVDAHGHRTMNKLSHRFDSLSTMSNPSQSEKKRKTKVDWKARWVIINQGTLFLCKDHVASPPLHQFVLSTMIALHGADALECLANQPRVVCIKFRSRSAPSAGVASPPPSLPSSPISEEIKISAQELPSIDSVSDSKRTPELEDSGEHPQNPYGTSKEKGEWVVLDMLDDHAFSSILRILHRQASHSISSSFVPSSSMITFSRFSMPSPATSSFTSYDTIPYPEWRINTVENARKAGMGDVSNAMAWVLWTEKGAGESPLGNIRRQRQAFSREMQYRTTCPPSIYCGSDDDSEDDSEMEWEGWMRDLERQSLVKQQLDKARRSPASFGQAQIAVSGSLPSPPLSEGSPTGSPKVRSSSSVSQLGGGLLGSDPSQYPNIDKVFRESGAHGHGCLEHPHSPEKVNSTTISTVSVGMTPSPRRRSSTVLAELGVSTRRDHNKGKREREPIANASENGGGRANARTMSLSSGLRYSPGGLVRHARSVSNLRVSSSPYGSDAAESGHPGPSSPSKRQSAFMRGVSLRAGKLVRGLESAIDFVDEKTI